MNKKQYKIESFRDILRGLKFPHFTGFVRFWDVMAESSEKSKINFFLQFVNFFIIWLLILIVLPDRSNQWLSLFSEFQWSFLPIGQIVAASIFYILTQTILGLTTFSWSSLFETAPRITVSITIILAIFLVLFDKLIIAFKERIKQDLILWRTSR